MIHAIQAKKNTAEAKAAASERMQHIEARINEAAARGEYMVEVQGALADDDLCTLEHYGYKTRVYYRGTEDERWTISWNEATP